MDEEKESDPESNKKSDYLDLGDEDVEGEPSNDHHSGDDVGEALPSVDGGSGATGIDKIRDVITNIKSIDYKKLVDGLNDNLRNLSTNQQIVIAIIASLLVGSIAGYNLGSAPLKEIREDVTLLEDMIGDLNQSLTQKNNALSECLNHSLDLDAQIEDLSSDLADSDLEIEGLHQEIDDLQEYALHISEVEIDADNHLAYITVFNPTSIPAVIRSIGLEAGDTYWVNATGIIEPVSSKRFQWSEDDAGATLGFIDKYRSYVVRVETVNGYVLEHWYWDLLVKISVREWGFRDNRLIVSVVPDTDQGYPLAVIQSIGLKRLYENDAVFYNVSMPLSFDPDSLTLGFGDYIWSEEESGAPGAFLVEGYYYKLRVEYSLYTDIGPSTCFLRTIERTIHNVESSDHEEQEPMEPP